MDSEITRPRTVDVVFAVVVGLWVAGVTWVVQLAAWAIEQVLTVEGLTMPAWGWPLAVGINAVVAGTPCVLLALLAQTPVVRATARTWSWAALAVGVLGSVRAVPIVHNEIYLAVLTATALVLAGVVAAAVPGRWWAAGPRLWYAAAAGLAMLLPWLWVGALGGWLETGLAVLAAGAVGLLTAALAGPVYRSGFTDTIGGRLLAGLAFTVPLLLVGAGTGGSGLQLAAMLALPALGFVVATLVPARGGDTGRDRGGRTAGLRRARGDVDPARLARRRLLGADRGGDRGRDQPGSGGHRDRFGGRPAYS
jgi:hypothetical protein